jgi:hypothetical protein
VTAPTHRPFGVSLLAFVVMLGGALDLVGGLLLLLERNDDAVLDRMGGSADEIAAYAVMTMIVGLVVIVVGAALRNGSNFARYFIAFIALIRLASLAYVIITFAKGDWYDALVPAVVYTLVAGYLLFDKDAQAFYDRSAA